MQKSQVRKWLDDEATMRSMINLTLEGDLAGSGTLGLSLVQINSFTITYRTEAHGDIISTNFILHEQEDMGTHSSILA